MRTKYTHTTGNFSIGDSTLTDIKTPQMQVGYDILSVKTPTKNEYRYTLTQNQGTKTQKWAT